MFTLRNRFKKNVSQQSYNLNIRAKKTSLHDCILSESYNNLNYNNSINSQSRQGNNLHQNDQQLEFSNDNQIRSNQLSNNNLYNMDKNNLNYESEYVDDQDFNNSLMDYSDLESEYNNLNYSDLESEFSGNSNCDNLDNPDEHSINMNDTKTFDGTKSNLNWNQECPFGIFKNFTNMSMFIWATKHMICEYYIQFIIHSNSIIYIYNIILATAAYQGLIQILLHPK